MVTSDPQRLAEFANSLKDFFVVHFSVDMTF